MEKPLNKLLGEAVSPDIGELYKNIGVRPKDASKLVKAHVTSVKGNDAAVVFAKSEKSVSDLPWKCVFDKSH